jgi:hypothetical protein
MVFHFLSHAEGAKHAAPGRRHSGGDKSGTVGAHGESAYRARVRWKPLQEQARHVNHHFWRADRLLGVNEPCRRATRLQHEVAATHRMFEQVLEHAASSVAHDSTTDPLPLRT